MIVQILAAAYSGSTLLDALLDSQPGIHGLGECAQCWEPKPPGVGRGPCHLCGTEAQDCDFWRGYFDARSNGACAASWAAERLGAAIVVDASKSAERFHSGPDCARVQIALAKAPHEWASSVLGHHPEKYTLESAWHEWEVWHARILAYCDASLFDPLFLTYAELTKDPVGALRRVCMWLPGVAFDPSPVEDGRMWNRKSHALGGNPAVIDQLSAAEIQTGGREKWMGGKYGEAAGRWRTIRYDDAWQQDASFRDQCARLYLSSSIVMRGQLARLGFGSPEQLAESISYK